MQAVLRTCQHQAPKAIEAEKLRKAAAKEEKDQVKKVEASHKDTTEHKAWQYWAQQEATLEKAEGEAAQHQHVKGNFNTVRVIPI